MHIAKERHVLTWEHHGRPAGVITGKVHDFVGRRGFEVDWIVRFPDAPVGAGALMCAELLPRAAEALNLAWIMLKVRDDYQAADLSRMAVRFGFILQERLGDVEYWHLECSTWNGVRV